MTNTKACWLKFFEKGISPKYGFLLKMIQDKLIETWIVYFLPLLKLKFFIV